MAPDTPPDRLPPRSQEAERSILGSMLRDNTVIDDVTQIVQVDGFYEDAHQKIFQAILDLHNKHHPVDLVTLGEELIQRKQVEDVGGLPYLFQLWDSTPTAANAEYYARIVRDRALVRNLIHASTEILRDAYDQAQPADEMLGSAERKILEIAEKGTTGEPLTLENAINEAYARIDTRHQGEAMSISGLSTGYADLDEITAGLQNSELVLVAARPSVGKCLAHDSEIVLADGRLATIEQIVARRHAHLLTLQDNWRLTLTEPSAYVDDALKPVYRVTTRLGRQIETTASHPFLTMSGWRPLMELEPGDRMAVPREIPVFGQETLRECEVKLLAYLIGDGSLTQTSARFTNGDPRVRADFTAAVAAFGGVTVSYEDSNGTRTPSLRIASDRAYLAEHRPAFGRRLAEVMKVQRRTSHALAESVGVSDGLVCLWRQGACTPNPSTFASVCSVLEVEPQVLAPDGLAVLRWNGKNPLAAWLAELGLWGKSAQTKTVPDVVCRLTRPLLALFLNRLFATDGWATVLEGGNTQLGYATVSERLARQIQHLLLRFGIIASLRKRAVKYREQRRIAWQLDITDPAAIGRFITEIGIFGKEEALTRVEAVLRTRKGYKTNRDVIPPAVWELLDRARAGESWCSLARRVGLKGHTNIHVGRRGLSRPRLLKFAEALNNNALRHLAASDVYWDEIVSIEATGLKQVYDLTIPETHNFVANDICVHNTAFALNVARNIAVDERQPVFFVSLEQSRIEIAERLLCCQARVDSHKLRKGNLSRDDMDKLVEAGGILREAKLFIDDTPGQNMLRIAANARRLKLRQHVKLVMIDYLQLIEPDNRRDPRQEQVAQISRRLKFLARELAIPVVALAQVNRSSEDRQDHRPRLADLRESGCLTGDTFITLADTGKRVPIRDLAGKSGFNVWSLDEVTMTVKPAEVSHAFCTGRKPIFRLTTRLGRSIRATANHKFRAFAGWRRLDELQVGDHVAVPRRLPCRDEATMTAAEVALLGHLLGDGCTLPCHALQYTTREVDLAQTVADLAVEVFGDRVRPRINPERRWYQVYLAATERLTHGKRNPVAEWLDRMGAFGFRSWEKRVPDCVFEQPEETLATFLRHLWATDGCIRPPRNKRRHPSIYYASSSRGLAQDVQTLLLRLGINAVLRGYDQGSKGRRQYHVMVMGKREVLTFADMVGAVGQYKTTALRECREWVASRMSNTNRDIVPSGIWGECVKPAMQARRITMRQLQSGIGMAFMGTGLYKQNVSRERLSRVVQALGGEPQLEALSKSDVYWDQVVSIEPDGEEEVYDLTVPGPSNFVADCLYVHNSLEQDSDTVMLLHRPDRYEPGQHEGIVEVIIGKQRNGPTGEITLAYIKQYMRFENFAIGTPFES